MRMRVAILTRFDDSRTPVPRKSTSQDPAYTERMKASLVIAPWAANFLQRARMGLEQPMAAKEFAAELHDLLAAEVSEAVANEVTADKSAIDRPDAGQLYSICALELFNHIVENADYLICGNENCRQKNFVHQQGVKKNWHRSNGVLYCSSACAHAVAQRKYRRRRLNRDRDSSGG
jgi:hypothetical protein